jgi:hypothetical protein
MADSLAQALWDSAIHRRFLNVEVDFADVNARQDIWEFLDSPADCLKWYRPDLRFSLWNLALCKKIEVCSRIQGPKWPLRILLHTLPILVVVLAISY